MGIELILDMARGAQPDRVALGRRDEGLTFADLDRAAAGGAAVLRAAGAGSVAYVGLNGPVLPALMFAAARAGIPLTPLNYRLSAGHLNTLIAELDHPYVVADRAVAEAVPAIALSEDWLAMALGTEPAAPRSRRRQRSGRGAVHQRHHVETKRAWCCGIPTCRATCWKL